jgi:hypothetical protein
MWKMEMQSNGPCRILSTADLVCNDCLTATIGRAPADVAGGRLACGCSHRCRLITVFKAALQVL